MRSIMAQREPRWQDLLKQVSRSFYLTLRILPRSVKEPIGFAYLLARATDTIADTGLVEISRRRAALRGLQRSILAACAQETTPLLDLADLAKAQATVQGEGTAGERMLLQRIGELLEVLRELPAEDRRKIGKLLDRITHGQESDLVKFGSGSESVAALETDAELDAYTYDVAGCVGEFWTEMCRAHVFPAAKLDDVRLGRNAVLFGKGLQLVNILRDLPGDLRRGRCYIPREQLAVHDLEPADLLDKTSMERFRPLYEVYLDRAEEYLAAGWEYTLALPYRCVRIRLACAWPILIGMRTIQKLRCSNVLDESHRVKLTRPEIRQIVLHSLLVYPNRKAWTRLVLDYRMQRAGIASK